MKHSRSVAIASAISAALALAQQQAHAQDAAASNEPVQQVVITGSRIARTSDDTPSPVTTLGSDELTKTQATNIGAALSSLPAFRASSNPTNDNHVASATYINLFGSYDFAVTGDTSVQLFGSVSNLFDKEPPFAPELQYPTNPTYFDQIGRTYRAGLRVKF